MLEPIVSKKKKNFIQLCKTRIQKLYNNVKETMHNVLDNIYYRLGISWYRVFHKANTHYMII